MGSAPTYECLYERLVRGEEKLALIGLEYVGMPIAVEFYGDCKTDTSFSLMASPVGEKDIRSTTLEEV